jgi:hypothetical protein
VAGKDKGGVSFEGSLSVMHQAADTGGVLFVEVIRSRRRQKCSLASFVPALCVGTSLSDALRPKGNLLSLT